MILHAKGQTLNIYPVNSACRAGVLLYRGGIYLHLYNKNFIVRNSVVFCGIYTLYITVALWKIHAEFLCINTVLQNFSYM